MILLFIIFPRRSCIWFALLFLLALGGCSWIPAKQGVWQAGDKKPGDRRQTDSFQMDKNLKPGNFFTTELKTSAQQYADPQKSQQPMPRSVGITFSVPEIVLRFWFGVVKIISQQEIIVSPDGLVALPRVGLLNVKGQTLKQVTDQCVAALKVYYENPEVTLVMRAFNNNKVFVLGRVATPGAVTFQGPGNLLEALSLAGGMPADVNKTFLSRCVITRGKNLSMWIDPQGVIGAW